MSDDIKTATTGVAAERDALKHAVSSHQLYESGLRKSLAWWIARCDRLEKDKEALERGNKLMRALLSRAERDRAALRARLNARWYRRVWRWLMMFIR